MAMMGWVRRREIPDDVWHLLEGTPRQGATATSTACGISLEQAEPLDRLDQANPRQEDRCPRCHAAYQGELQRS